MQCLRKFRPSSASLGPIHELPRPRQCCSAFLARQSAHNDRNAIGRPCPFAQRRQRALDRLPARHVPAGLFRQPHQPSGRDRALVGVAARSCDRCRGPVAAKDYWEKGVRAPLPGPHVQRAVDRPHRHQGASKPGRPDAARDRRPVFADRVSRREPQRRGRRSANSRAGCIIWRKSGRTWNWCRCTSTI